MTVEEAVRDELRDARHEEIKLFAEFMQCLGDPQLALFKREQLQDAAQKSNRLRNILHGVIEGQRILRDRQIEQG